METLALSSDAQRSSQEFNLAPSHETITVEFDLNRLSKDQLRTFIVENWGKKIIFRKRR